MSKEHGMIENFCDRQYKTYNGKPAVSYGVSSYGYDVRCGEKFLVPRIHHNAFYSIVDLACQDQTEHFEEHIGDSCIIPPSSFVLAITKEKFNMPDNIIGICVGKSTYARCGIIVNTTPIEPQWSGYITLEISNTNIKPVKIYAGHGICQVMFLASAEKCDVGYKDRKGKYDAQESVQCGKL